MRFVALALPGAFLVELKPHRDERGWFVRTYDERLFIERGLETRFSQRCSAWNRSRGTVRGLHWQAPPADEVKLVRCVRGAIFDVLLDVRPASSTFGQWVSTELRAGDERQLYVPPQVAHGYVTLKPDTEVVYDIAGGHDPGSARGVRWNDETLGIPWPLDGEPVISARDREHPPFTSMAARLPR